MQQEQILAIMKAYFADLHGPEALADFQTTIAVELIEDDVDAVTIVMHLEDETGLDIPMAQVAAGFTGQRFQEQARRLHPRQVWGGALSDGQADQPAGQNLFDPVSTFGSHLRFFLWWRILRP